MQAFISWSGPRSKAVALALSQWLGNAVRQVEPWMSERDILAGQPWNDEVRKALANAKLGIICVTPENVASPWLLFEAGALANALDSSRVVPVVLGMRTADLGPPLAQFEGVETDRNGLWALALAANAASGEDRLEKGRLFELFEVAWPWLESRLHEAVSSAPHTDTRPPRSESSMLEDVLEGVRTVQRLLTADRPIQAERTGTLGDWQDYYIRGVNLANNRESAETDTAALLAYGDAIAVAPNDLPQNMRSRLHAYRAAVLKRLGRLAEAEQDLVLALQWATEDREIEDAEYNMAGVMAMQGRHDEALVLVRRLVEQNRAWASVIKDRTRYFGSLKADPRFEALTASA